MSDGWNLLVESMRRVDVWAEGEGGAVREEDEGKTELGLRSGGLGLMSKCLINVGQKDVSE